MATIKLEDLMTMNEVSDEDAENIKGGPLEIRELHIKVNLNESK